MLRFDGRNPVPAANKIAVPTLLAAVVLLSGCNRSPAPALLIATSWPEVKRNQLQDEFQAWRTASSLGAPARPIHLQWLALVPGDDIEPVVLRRRPPDILLGASTPVLDRLAREQRLMPVGGSDQARYCITSRGAARPAELGDPRTDAPALAWARHQLLPGRWKEGYASLVDVAGHSPRIGRHAGLEQGIHAQNGNAPVSSSFDSQGLGVLATASDPASAREFERFFLETQQAQIARGPGAVDEASDAKFGSLLADLLGATLVDAQDELWKAWAALKEAGSPVRASQWLTEPPPWPPASVEKYLKREGERAMSLVETLAGELSPRPPVRAWLIRSWLSPPRLVDEALLMEMVHVADGDLVSEPRFRSWLRAEWTASARQRYRRVAKLASQTQPVVDNR